MLEVAICAKAMDAEVPSKLRWGFGGVGDLSLGVCLVLMCEDKLFFVFKAFS